MLMTAKARFQWPETNAYLKKKPVTDKMEIGVLLGLSTVADFAESVCVKYCLLNHLYYYYSGCSGLYLGVVKLTARISAEAVLLLIPAI